MTHKYTNRSRLASMCRGILVVMMAFAGTGCQVCTESGCFDFVRIELEEPLPPGEYHLTVTKDGEPESCTVQIPEAPSTDPPEGCALEGVRFDFNDSIAVYGDPATLGVSLEHLASGETVSRVYEVQYTVSSAEGENCRPTLTLDTSDFVSTINGYEFTGLGGAPETSASP